MAKEKEPVRWSRVRGFDRAIVFRQAWDKRDPDPSKNYGIHSVEVSWYLRGPKGAVSFLLFTGWMLEGKSHEPMAADLGYHSLEKGNEISYFDDCEALGTGVGCYYDGSSFAADHLFRVLKTGGGEALWLLMEGRYDSHFGGKGYE